MDTHTKIREHISTLVDDELSSDDLELAMAALQSPDGQQAMHTYHQIGDVLRSQAGPGLSEGFMQRLGERLQREPVYGRQKARVPGKPPSRAADKRSASAVSGDSGNSGNGGNSGNDGNNGNSGNSGNSGNIGNSDNGGHSGNSGHCGAGEPMAPAEAVAATTKPAIASVS